MATSRPSLIGLWNKLSWICILTCVMYVPNLNENCQSMSNIPHFQKNKMAASRPSLIQSWNQCTCICPPLGTRYVQSLKRIGPGTSEIQVQPNSHTDGRTDGQTDTKSIESTYVCYDVLSIYEVWSELLQACLRYSSRHTFSHSKWPPVGHLWSNHEIIARAYVPHKVLGMYKVWKESVQGHLRYSRGRTHGRTDGRTDGRTECKL